VKRGVMLILILVAAGVSGRDDPPARPQSSTVQGAEKIVVHLKHFTDDLHAAYMAMQLAARLQAKGAEVTLLLDLDGARFADAQGAGIRDTSSRNFEQSYAEFVRDGGRGLVCRHCASLHGIDRGQLRKQMTMASMDGIAGAVFSADKIIDY